MTVDTSEPPIIVEQGPEWLAEILYNPPGWAQPVLMLVIVAGSFWLIYQFDERDLTVEAKLAMVQNVLAVVCCGGLTWMLVEHATFSYVADVAFGALGGFTLAIIGRYIATPVIASGRI